MINGVDAYAQQAAYAQARNVQPSQGRADRDNDRDDVVSARKQSDPVGRSLQAETTRPDRDESPKNVAPANDSAGFSNNAAQRRGSLLDITA